MAAREIQRFLEGSTIHGLVHISTAKSKSAKLAWVAIVLVCFAIAVYMITNSYKEWQESPVSTTITTHPITELEFPMVTVCPPRGSNTALNHLLENVRDVNFTEKERNELLDISREVFLETPNKKHAGQMTELLSPENRRSIANGNADMPKVDKQGLITLSSSEPEGSFSTPGFAGSEYKGDFFERPQSLHYVLDFPDTIRDIVEEGELVISIETQGNWSFLPLQDKFQLYKGYYDYLTMAAAAEEFCARLGGHLASVGSQRENDLLVEVAEVKIVWLGGKLLKRTVFGSNGQLNGWMAVYQGTKTGLTLGLHMLQTLVVLRCLVMEVGL